MPGRGLRHRRGPAATVGLAAVTVPPGPGLPYGWIAPLAVLIAVLVTALVRRRLRRRHPDRAELDRWARDTDHQSVAVDRPWPWAPLVLAPAMVTVSSAYAGELDGLSVVVGEISWVENGLGDAVDRWNGRGVFTVVALPGARPRGAVREWRNVYARQDGQDEFPRRFRTIATDPDLSARLADPALRDCHVRGDIPPWTIQDGELFTIVSVDTVTPGAIEDAARRTVRVVDLLRLRP
jgi:hypothetical protein